MATLEDTATRLARLAEAARQSAEIAADDREARDQAIEDAERWESLSVRDIARHTKLDAGHVSKILAKRTAERQARK